MRWEVIEEEATHIARARRLPPYDGMCKAHPSLHVFDRLL
jgi:hypothetical protein